MTVGELRKALEGVPDDVLVMRGDSGEELAVKANECLQVAAKKHRGELFLPRFPRLETEVDYTIPVFVID
jgi:predicted metal-dependent hydrolase